MKPKSTRTEHENMKTEIQIKKAKQNETHRNNENVSVGKQELIKIWKHRIFLGMFFFRVFFSSLVLLVVRQGGDISMIGQFGVGFYSAYLVSDKAAFAKNGWDD